MTNKQFILEVSQTAQMLEKSIIQDIPGLQLTVTKTKNTIEIEPVTVYLYTLIDMVALLTLIKKLPLIDFSRSLISSKKIILILNSHGN